MQNYQITFCRATGWAIYEPIARPWEPWYRLPTTHAVAPCAWPVARRFDQYHWNDHVAPALAQSCPGDRYRALDALAAHLHLQRADDRQVSVKRVLALGYLPLDTPATAFALAIERCTDRGWRVSIPRMAAALGLDAGRYLVGRHGPRRMLRVLAEEGMNVAA